MVDLPADLLEAIPPGSAAVVQRWWASLTDDDRLRVAALWDRRHEVHFFTPQADDSGRLDDWTEMPKVRGGRFVPPDDARGLAEWGPGYFEHLLQHPELVPVWEPARRTFYIGCTRHAAARSCLESGEVPPEFACPAGLASCPLFPLRGGRLIRGHRSGESSRTLS